MLLSLKERGKGMIYTVTVRQRGTTIRFGFNTFSEMIDFLRTVLESVDGLEEGETEITVKKEEEKK